MQDEIAHPGEDRIFMEPKSMAPKDGALEVAGRDCAGCEIWRGVGGATCKLERIG
jgi:hypothetical protein